MERRTLAKLRRCAPIVEGRRPFGFERRASTTSRVVAPA
jgi:hypothetical protein